jgi:hypothetical protein
MTCLHPHPHRVQYRDYWECLVCAKQFAGQVGDTTTPVYIRRTA